MDVRETTERWQRAIVLALLPISALVFWPKSSDAVFLPKASLIVLGVVLIGALGALRAVHERRVLVPWTPLAAALGVLGVALLLTTVTSSFPMLSVIGEFGRYSGLVGYLSFIALAVVVLRTFTRSDVVRLVEVGTVTFAV